MAALKLNISDTALLIVDMQQRLVPVIEDGAQLVKQTRRLIKGANVLGLPVIITEQYPQGLGKTVDELSEILIDGNSISGDKAQSNLLGVFEKIRLSACIDSVRKLLIEKNIRSVIVAGIEAHICVQQSCIDLINCGFIPAIVHDAVGSRHSKDCQTALKRMECAGAIPVTVESVLMELIQEAGNEKFKQVQAIIK